MALENLKTPSIVAYDTKPLVGVSTGQGAAGSLRSVNDHVAASAASSIGSTYRLVRLPSNAVIKHVFLRNALFGAGSALDLDVAFSDSVTDGTLVGFQATIPQIASADNRLFGSALAVAAAQQIEVTFSNIFTTAHQNLPLWNVLVNLGVTTFAADPGGFFDILAKVTTAFTNGGDLAVECQFVTD